MADVPGPADLKKLFDQWAALNLTYCRRYHQEVEDKDKQFRDCVWWMAERPCLGLLSVAAWQQGRLAVTDYVDSRGDSKKPVDLWIHDVGGQELVFEAKYFRKKVSKKAVDEFLESAADRLAKAEQQISHLESRIPKMLLVFAVPKIPCDEGPWRSVLEAFRTELRRRCAEQGNPSVIRELFLDRDEEVPSEKGMKFPGVIVFGKRLPSW